MRHGWKTRIEERRYFEEKKEDREQMIAMRRMANRHMEHQHEQILEEMKKKIGRAHV